MKSIIQTDRTKTCYVCGTTQNIHLHHCFFGNPNRKLSDKYGLVVHLCYLHHNGSNEGVHFNKDLDNHLKQLAQAKFEEVHGSREDFVRIFGRNYL